MSIKSYSFDKVVIVGVGLIGGSLALALRERQICKQIVGITRSKASARSALELGICDEMFEDLKDPIKDADLMVIATVPKDIVSTALSVQYMARDDLIITDVGSVKGEIVNEIESKLRSGLRFIGAHPIAGSEKSGPTAAFSSLFKDQYTIITPTVNSDEDALSKVRYIWESVGSKVVDLDPFEHDLSLALISHLPHMLAYSLVDTLKEADRTNKLRKFIAGGFKSMTRVVASPPEMWRDIFIFNKDAIIESATIFERQFSLLKKRLESDDFGALESFLEDMNKIKIEMDSDG